MEDSGLFDGFNPYWLAYARAHGKTPWEMIDHDRAEWPGGCMTGYMLWITAAKRRAFEVHPDWFSGGPDNLYRFDHWEWWLEKMADEGMMVDSAP